MSSSSAQSSQGWCLTASNRFVHPCTARPCQTRGKRTAASVPHPDDCVIHNDACVPLQQISHGKLMLCGLFDRVCCLPAPVSDPDTGPTRGTITQESALALNAALSSGGEGLKHHVTEKAWRTPLQRKNGVNATQVHKIYHSDRRAWVRFVSLAVVKLSIEFKSKQFLVWNTQKTDDNSITSEAKRHRSVA